MIHGQSNELDTRLEYTIPDWTIPDKPQYIIDLYKSRQWYQLTQDQLLFIQKKDSINRKLVALVDHNKGQPILKNLCLANSQQHEMMIKAFTKREGLQYKPYIDDD